MLQSAAAVKDGRELRWKLDKSATETVQKRYRCVRISNLVKQRVGRVLPSMKERGRVEDQPITFLVD